MEDLVARTAKLELVAARINAQLIESGIAQVTKPVEATSDKSSPELDAVKNDLLVKLQALMESVQKDFEKMNALEQENKKLLHENGKLKYRVNILLESLNEAERKN